MQPKTKKNIATIEINDAVFTLNMEHELISDLIAPHYTDGADALGTLLVDDSTKFATALNAALKKDYSDDPAMCYFIMITLLSIGELQKAKKFITPLYQKQSSSLLMRCAYAEMLSFDRNKTNDIAAVFGGTFDLDKITNERSFPLPIFVKFMEVACSYYQEKHDIRNFMKHLAYLLEVAPALATTQSILRSLGENYEESDEEGDDNFKAQFGNFLNLLNNMQQEQQQK